MSIAITLAQYLLDRDVAYDLVPRPHGVSGVPAEELAEAVVLKGEAGFMLAVVPASHRIRFKDLGQLLDSYVDMANEEQVETLFLDCEPGAVPALGGAYGLKVVVDDSLAQEPDIYFEAGDHASLVHISGTSFQQLMADARHGRFSGPIAASAASP